MKLSLNGLNDLNYKKYNYDIPTFDIETIRKNTNENPQWLHFGAGNIFRAFPAVICQNLIESGNMKTGITVVECFDEEIIDKAFKPFDNLTLAISLKSNGTVEKKIVASICEALKYSENKSKLKNIFEMDSLQMVSFTITEKGYSVIESDFSNIENPTSIIGILTKLMYDRFKSGKKKLALVSMDNCSHNGTILYNSVKAISSKWIENGFVEAEFADYIDDENTVSFPWSMIDKITPRPSEDIIDMLKKEGFEGADIVVTSKNTHVSGIVNAEECEYLAIEDHFPNGRPDLEKFGVILSDRSTVDKIEKMKVCTCLNPLHTTLAIFGCLFSYNKISEEMKDETLVSLIKKIGYIEGMPVVTDPKVMSAEKFINEVLELRLPNPFMPDTPQRIACDTSKKIAVRFGETLKSYINQGKTDLSFLNYIPLTFAGYARYLTGINDKGESFELSPDPNLQKLTSLFEDFKIGANFDQNKLRKFFSDESIFGVNLYEYGLGEKSENMFLEMSENEGSIRKTLNKYLGI